MRWRIALCLTLALTVLAMPSLAAPVLRRRVVSGQSTIARLDRPGEFHEFLVAAARGSKIVVQLGGAGPGSCNPIGGVLDGNYSAVPVFGRSVRSFSTPLGVPRSGDYRVVTTGAGQTVGSFKTKVTIKPAKTITLNARARTDPTREIYPPTSLTFGAYPGYSFTVQVKWKGPAPVTLDSVTGPDGAELIATQAAKPRKRATKHSGYVVNAFGDHRVRVNVPAGTQKWAITVKLAGKLEGGGSVDIREPPGGPSGVQVLSAVGAPLAQVVSENGGPNDFAVAAQDGLPIASFSDRRSGSCVRATVELDGSVATTYDLRCTNGFLARVSDLVRDAEGHVRSFEIPVARSPLGAGSASVTGLVYDGARKPIEWTEVRHFPASGNTHTLAFTDVERYTNLDINRTQFLPDTDESLLEIDEPIVAGTVFTDAVMNFTPHHFDRRDIVPGDFLQLVAEQGDLVALGIRREAHVVTRNVRPLRILEVAERSLTLEEPLVDEAPPPGARFSYRVLRRTDFIRSFTVTHTDADGITRSYYEAGGRVR